VDRALRILQTLARAPLRQADLARTLRLPKSTTLALLRTLRHHEAVAYEPSTGRYHLGRGLVALAHSARGYNDLRRLARPVIEDLARQTGETVILHVLAGEDAVILDRQESPHQLRVAAPLGHVLPPLAGAVGKVQLAHLSPQDAARRLARRSLPRYTPRSITNRTIFLRELDRVRRMGYATDDEEYLPGVRALSAPILGPEGDLAGILDVVGVKTRFTDLKMARAASRLRAAARKISQELAGPSSRVGAGPAEGRAAGV